MGADLCGFLLKGPAKLHRVKIRQAKKLYTELRMHLGGSTEKFKEFLVQWGKATSSSAARCYVTLGIGPKSEADELEEVREKVKQMPPKLVDRFVDMWANGDYRDMVRRDDPDDKSQQLLFVGERTCGDGPDDDSAWGLAALMDDLGLLTVSGVR